jgi:hypothetical protein
LEHGLSLVLRAHDHGPIRGVPFGAFPFGPQSTWGSPVVCRV